MKTLVGGAHRVKIQLYPNPAMIGLHTTIDINELRGNIDTNNALLGIASRPGIETNGLGRLRTTRYELSLEVGEAFDRTTIAERAARELLELVEPGVEVQDVTDALRPFTVIGAYNNYCSYGPTMNNDGEIKLSRRCVLATNCQEAIESAQQAELSCLTNEVYNNGTDYIVDQPVAFEGNPLNLVVEHAF